MQVPTVRTFPCPLSPSIPKFEQGINEPLMPTVVHDPASRIVQSSKIKHTPLHSQKFEDAEIMIVDFDALEKAEGDVRKHQVQLIGEAFEKIGFIGIRASKIVPIINNIYPMMDRYLLKT